MPDRDSLMKKIQTYDFYLVDLHLFLDSHPNCKEALEYFKKYKELSDAARDEYAKNFGPITASQSLKCDKNAWAWIESPWPWEKGE